MLALILSLLFSPLHAIERLEVRGDQLDFDLEKFELVTLPDDKDISETLLRLPNITRAGGANRSRFFQIRGIGDRGQFEHSQMSPIGVFYEGIDLSEEASVLPLNGHEHIKVKYGPDSLSWGAKAIAGSLEVSSCLTSECPNIYAQLGYASFETYSAKLTGKFGNFFIGTGMTISDGHNKNIYKNEYTHNLDEKQIVFGGKYSLGEWQLKHHHLIADSNNGYDTWNFNGSYETLSDHPGKDKHLVHGHSIALEKETDRGLWKILFSGTFTKQLESYDEDWGNNPYWNTISGWNQNYNYYSEFHRERFKGHGKISYIDESGIEFGIHHYQYHEKQEIKSFKDENLRKTKKPDYETINTAFWLGYNKIFHSSEIRIASRFEEQRNELEESNLLLKDKNLMWGWDIELETHHKNNLSSNYLLQKGYRGGGYNIDNSLPQELMPYEEESLYHAQYSLMWRPENYFILGRVFSYWYRDQQVKDSKQLDPMDPNTFSYFTSNKGKSYSQGVEFSLSRRMGQFNIYLNAGLMRAKLSGEDRELPYAPKWNYQLRGEYLIGNFMLYSQIKNIGNYYYSLDHDHKAPETYLVDMGINYKLKNVGLDFWVKNVFDKKHPIRAYYFANEPPNWEDRLYTQNSVPRVFGVDLSLQF